MNRDDIIRMAREAGIGWLERAEGISEFLERFANLVVAAERERIIAANAPEIEKVNAYIKALAQPEPYAAQAAMVDQQTQGRMYVDPVTGDVGIGNPNQVTLDTSGGTTFSSTPIDWDASAPLVVTPHPAFKKPWVGLTDEEIDWLWGLAFEAKLNNIPRHFARMVEEKLKEKNHGN